MLIGVQNYDISNHQFDKGRRQNSKDVVTNLPLKLATSGNWEVSDIWYTYSDESSQLGCEKLVTVGDLTHQFQGPSAAFSGEFWRLPQRFWHQGEIGPKYLQYEENSLAGFFNTTIVVKILGKF